MVATVTPIRSARAAAARVETDMSTHTDQAGRGFADDVTNAIGRTVARTTELATSTVSSVISVASDTATAGVRAATRRLMEVPTSDTVDNWGRDPRLVRDMMIAAQIRWDVSTGGDQHLPKKRGALIVVNAPQFMLTPIFAAFAISEAVDRPVRYVGRSHGDFLGAIGQRIGGLLAHPDEVAGALRADELVIMGAAASRGPRSVGVVDHTIVGAALASGVRVFPAASSSSPFGRAARIEIGPATRPPRRRRGPLSELELADRIRDNVRDLLAEMGDINTGTPLDWLPLSGLGAH